MSEYRLTTSNSVTRERVHRIGTLAQLKGYMDRINWPKDASTSWLTVYPTEKYDYILEKIK